MIPLISDVGFPIVVTLYLLHRIEAKLNVLIDTMQSLPDQLKGDSGSP
ncbi:YvrJ family protein [Bacillus sp. JJ722]